MSTELGEVQKSLLLERAVASLFASLLGYFENAKVYTKAMMPFVNATQPLLYQFCGTLAPFV